MRQAVRAKGPGREGGPMWAGPFHKGKRPNNFQEHFDPAEEQDLLPILSPSLRNGNAPKGLKGGEKMHNKRQRPGMCAAKRRSKPRSTPPTTAANFVKSAC